MTVVWVWLLDVVFPFTVELCVLVTRVVVVPSGEVTQCVLELLCHEVGGPELDWPEPG